ncbi:MAG: flagellar biosynthesis protein FlhA [Nocardioidaceae bacterium]|nr:flagellar biosynthesis protein FlhA [Nocardioidaceae bacterium]
MRNQRLAKLGVPLGVVAVVVMLVVPLPPMVLDLLIAANIIAGVLILTTAMAVRKPLDFSSFPAVLLIATLFRLALNISATRLVLLDGYAGKVIETFGHFVVGGSLVVGIIVFAILVVIQFVVITNGAGRVAEVGARFKLDAMPGKQMAIDADLNSGLIDEDEARRRRAEVSEEADFYGAMDGASKFVKGDAIAAVIITLVNLLGGFTVGVLQNGMTMGDAVQTYSLLTVGDGLVSQIPALLLSVATGLIVTRAASQNDMGSDIVAQLTRDKQPLRIAGFAAIALCIIPGMPKLPFLVVAAIFLFLGFRPDPAPVPAEGLAELEAAPKEPDTIEALLEEIQVDPLELELSADLVDLVDSSVGGDLLSRVKSLRRKVAEELGVVVPPVRTRDNLDLPLRTYAIRLFGVEVARGTAPPGTVLAIGDNLTSLPGERTLEPVFGLDAVWIPAELRSQAEISGATVVDRASVVTTHLADVVRRNAARLLGREETRMLSESLRRTHPTVVEELTPAQMTLGEVQRVLQRLLAEGVSIRDLARIFESLSLRAAVSKDVDGLVLAAREALGPALLQPFAEGGVVHVISFDPALEQRMLESFRMGEDGGALALDPDVAQQMLMQLGQLTHESEQADHNPVLACAPQLRAAVQRLVTQAGAPVPVLSYTELSTAQQISSVGVLHGATAVGA